MAHIRRLCCFLGLHRYIEQSAKEVKPMEWLIHQRCRHCEHDRTIRRSEWEQMSGV
jgi:hypothetical protein